MYNTYSSRRIRAFDPARGDSEFAPRPLNAAPGRSPRSVTMIGVLLLLSAAAISVGALLVEVPLALTASIAFVLGAYFVATALLFTRAGRADGRGDNPVVRVRAAERLRREIAPLRNTIVASAGAVAVLSIGLLAAALVAPGTMGVSLAALGLAGLFALRMLATTARWAPRRLAWAGRPARA